MRISADFDEGWSAYVEREQARDPKRPSEAEIVRRLLVKASAPKPAKRVEAGKP